MSTESTQQPASPPIDTSSMVTVVGAGLGGCMVALMLARRNVKVRVIEGREDWREAMVEDEVKKAQAASGPLGQLTSVTARSINLALSHRGICALEKVGLFDVVRPWLIPMIGRAVHNGADGDVTLQPYGTDHQAIYSVSRMDLNRLLLDELCKLANVQVLFGKKVRRCGEGYLITTNNERLACDFIIGADGAFSRVRQSICRLARANISQTFISHGYKELTVMPRTDTGDFALQPSDALHIWPRHEFMLIALPNPDKTFTATLFAPFEVLETLDHEESVREFFAKYFPDACTVIPDYVEQCLAHPTSALPTVRMDPWNYKHHMVLLGDAAHAVVPFYGQGMNAAFEDALVFDETWEACDSDPKRALPEYNRRRQPIGNALADLSLENYVEMRSKTASPLFALRQRVDRMLHMVLGDAWIPKYTMVSFTRIPYDEVKRRAERQDRVIGRAAKLALYGGIIAATSFVVRNFVPASTKQTAVAAVSSFFADANDQKQVSLSR